MNLKEFVEKHNIDVHIIREPYLAIPDRFPNGSKAWGVTFMSEEQTLYVPFFTSPGIKTEPTIEEVLNCLAQESASVENARSMEEWARDLGYDSASPMTDKAYLACVNQANGLSHWLGEAAYNELLWGIDE